METQNDVHLILIADESGIASAFNRVKARLANRSSSHLTLIYALLGDTRKPLFAEELRTIEKRFSSVLEVKMIAHENNPATMRARIKEAIEVVINCNIQPAMQFYTGGNPELVDPVKKFLVFLGVAEKEISAEISPC